MEKDKSSNVKVYVRVRPPLEREINSGNKYTSCLAVRQNKVLITKADQAVVISGESLGEATKAGGVSTFDYDGVFGEESTQESIFEGISPPLLESFLQGINCTLFTYGVTGSGKTFTVDGVPNAPGIFERVGRHLFNHVASLSDRPESTLVEFSAVQIYLEECYDLLSKNSKLNMRVVKNQVYFDEPFGVREASNLEELLTHYTQAKLNKVSAATHMNASSTRGHVVYTIYLTSRHKNTGKVTESKFNIVDLAGCEKIDLSGATGQRLKEAIKINQSLNTLIMVVEALVDSTSIHHQLPPFRDSKLTLMLRDSLGGKCQTSMIVAVSPSLFHAGETLRSLKFGSIVRYVKNTPTENVLDESVGSHSSSHANKFFNREQYRQPKPKEKEKEVVTIPWENLKSTLRLQTYHLETRVGKIFVQDNGAAPERKQLVILMHACPSHSEELLHFFPGLTHYNYRVVAFDQPGYGRSTGTCHPSRSERNLDEKGPANVALEIAQQLGFSSFIAGGYDWGAGVALSLAQRDSKKTPKVIALLPSWSPSQDSEIKAISAKVLVIWVKHDQMHSWTRWKTIANKLANKTIHMIESRQGQQRGGGNAYEGYSDEMMREIIKFLGFPDPLAQKIEVKAAQESKVVNTKGAEVTKAQLIMLQEDLTMNQIQNLATNQTAAASTQSALQHILMLKSSKKLNEALLAKDKTLLDLVRNLPDLSPWVVRDNPNILLELGVWTSLPKNLDTLWKSPRYYKGRRVLATVPTCSIVGDPNFLKYCEGKAEYPSYSCVLQGWNPVNKVFSIKVETTSGQHVLLQKSLDQILLMNHPQEFGKEVLGTNTKLYLEDGIRGNYSCPITKTKMYEIALAIGDQVSQLDFAPKTEAERANLLELQQNIVKNILSCFNITSFASGCDRTRIGRTDNIGLLATNGQAQCHGLSSTTSGYLVVFAELLGLDLLYRGGTSYFTPEGGIKGAALSNAVEKHQWLQVNYRPSMHSTVLDLWYALSTQSPWMLTYPLEKAMQSATCPHPKLLLKNTLAELSPSDIQF